MAIDSPIPIPAEFDELSDSDKRRYLRALRERLERTSTRDPEKTKQAILEVVAGRQRDMKDDASIGLTIDEVYGPLADQYSKS